MDQSSSPSQPSKQTKPPEQAQQQQESASTGQHGTPLVNPSVTPQLPVVPFQPESPPANLPPNTVPKPVGANQLREMYPDVPNPKKGDPLKPQPDDDDKRVPVEGDPMKYLPNYIPPGRGRFKAAVEIVQKLPKEGPLQTSNDQKLKFYSLYKQATIGNVNTDRPGFFSPVERAKWDAWKGVEGMSADEAKEKYIETLLEMFDNAGAQVNVNDNSVNKWLSKIDPSIKTNLAFLGKNL